MNGKKKKRHLDSKFKYPGEFAFVVREQEGAFSAFVARRLLAYTATDLEKALDATEKALESKAGNFAIIVKQEKHRTELTPVVYQ